jgi:hypothetical protein
MTASYEQIKDGRYVTAFKFVFVLREDKKRVRKKTASDSTRIDGVLKTDIDKFAKPGESYQQVATRLRMEQMMLEKTGKPTTIDIKL